MNTSTSYHTPLQRYIILVTPKETEWSVLSKKKVLKAILLALSVLLTTMQELEEKEESEPARFIEEIE